MTSFQFRFIFPLHLYPPIAPKVVSKRATNPLPSHGLTAEYFSWSKPKETTRPIRPPSQSGKSVFFCGRNQPGASRSAAQRARKGRGLRTRGPGVQPRHAFGDFRRETKVTRGLGRSAQIRRRRGYQPRTNSRGLGRSAQIRRRRGCQPRTNSRGVGRSAQIRGRRGYQPRTNSPRGAEHGKAMLAERPLTPQE